MLREMKLIHKITSNNKGLTLLEVVVAAGLIGALSLYVSQFQRDKLVFDKKMSELNSLEDYSSNFMKIIDFNEGTDPQGNLCFSIFNGVEVTLSSNATHPHHIPNSDADDVIHILPQGLDALTFDKQFFEPKTDGSYGFGDYRLERLVLSSGENGSNSLTKVTPPGVTLFEDIYRANVHFVFRNLKTGEDVQTKKKTLILAYSSNGSEIISCSGPTKLDLSLLGRCEIWGKYSKIEDGECKIPRHLGRDITNMVPDDEVTWTDPNQIGYGKTARETICDLQNRAGITEGNICE